MRTEWAKLSFKLLLVAVFAVATPVASLAQQDGQLWTVSTVQVHQDMIGEFEELQKELSAAYKKAGVTTRLVSQVVRGPSAEYRFSSRVEKWADYDDAGIMAKALGEAGAARWVARVRKCVKNRRVDTIRTRPDLSIPLKEGRTPRLAVLTTRRHLPGQFGEYNDWLVNKWVPAMKQAGANGVFYSRNAFGGNGREWTSISLIDDWASFDEGHPVRRSLGDEKYFELLGGAGSLTSAPVRKILRLRPDLGIINSDS